MRCVCGALAWLAVVQWAPTGAPVDASTCRHACGGPQSCPGRCGLVPTSCSMQRGSMYGAEACVPEPTMLAYLWAYLLMVRRHAARAGPCPPGCMRLAVCCIYASACIQGLSGLHQGWGDRARFLMHKHV